MKRIRVLHGIFSIFILTSVAACGGSGSDSGTGGAGTSVGPIASLNTARNTVSVNSVEFSTNGASVTKEGTASDQSELHLGMIVAVHGSFDGNGTTGSAHEIDFHDNLEGPIQSIDTGTQSLVAVCQTVQTDSDTHYRSDVDGVPVTGLSDLQAGYVIEVSGLVQNDGTILATYIELKSTSYIQGQKIEVKGVIHGLDTTAQTFEIVSGPTALTVDYSQVNPENLPSGGFSDGMYVEVKSTSEPVGCVLNASRIEIRKSDFFGDEGSRAELEGFITRYVSPTDFDVNGHPVSTTDSTLYEHGTVADLAQDVRVEIEGTLDSNGVLIANKISIESEDEHNSPDNGSEDGHDAGENGTDG